MPLKKCELECSGITTHSLFIINHKTGEELKKDICSECYEEVNNFILDLKHRNHFINFKRR